jgi:hypothetical protein
MMVRCYCRTYAALGIHEVDCVVTRRRAIRKRKSAWLPEWRRPGRWQSYMTEAMFVRYLWWAHAHVCYDCGQYHSAPN